MAADAKVLCRNYAATGTVKFDYGAGFAYALPWAAFESETLQQDLLALAGTVMTADRSFRRRERLGQWSRTFDLTLAVFDPKLWTKSAVPLVRALSFLTGDNWQFQFKKRPRTHTPIRPHQIPATRIGVSEEARPDRVILFSGGLDSFCGACHAFRESSKSAAKAHPVFVSSYTSGRKRLAALLTGVSEMMGKRLEKDDRPIPFEFTPVYQQCRADRIQGLDKSELPEGTRRARSFFFLMQGVVGCLQFKVHRLLIYENGVVALNLPQRADLTNSRPTSHAHPWFLHHVNQFLQTLLGNQAPAVDNPYVNHTKAEILTDAGGAEKLVGDSISCWGYPNYTNRLRDLLGKPDITHCGACFACLVRRVSIEAAKGFSEPQKIYAHDVVRAAKRGFRPRQNEPAELWADARVMDRFARWVPSLSVAEFHRVFVERLVHIDPQLDTRDLNTTRELYDRFCGEIRQCFRLARRSKP